ncbi:MAG: hypothetical protein J6B29_04840 [Clostridia bacterium]|nr:hypothetical protein [Clostridia bacterium]
MEQIYTIPVNEAFEACMEKDACDCPLCRIYDKLEKKEIEMALGPSMMEPSTRMQTNEKGFCPSHFDMLLNEGNRLSLALVLESHLTTLKDKMDGNLLSKLFGGRSRTHIKVTRGVGDSCFICDRIEPNFQRMLETTVLLYAYDSQFKLKMKGQKYFCLPHYQRLVEYAKDKLDKTKYEEFFKEISEIQNGYFEKIIKDVSWFCKKFDYRYDSEPWYDSKDAVERAIRFLSSGVSPDKK